MDTAAASILTSLWVRVPEHSLVAFRDPHLLKYLIGSYGCVHAAAACTGMHGTPVYPCASNHMGICLSTPV